MESMKKYPIYRVNYSMEDEVSGINLVSIVDDPAIQLNSITLSEEEIYQFGTKDSYTDYPEAARNAAKRALKWKEENGSKCGTSVGWTRANQLANGEAISEETINRMASFKRHQQNKDVSYEEGCGGIMWDAWGGDAGIEWAIRKAESLRNEKMSNEIELFLSNEDEMRVVGPALVPDKPIFRKKNGGYFIYFTKEDIKNLVKKFNRTGSNSRIGLDHNGSVSDAYINEQWIVEDPSKDKSSFYNLTVESGTWMLDVQITDENLWNEIKKKKTLGFSIEAMLGLKINDVSMSNDELREDEVVDTNIEETTEARVEELSEGVSDVETTEETTETTSEESTEETVNETEETVEEVVEEVTEAELSEDMPTDVAESPEVTVDMEGKMNQLEMMIAELIGKVSSLESKVASESEVNMKNEAMLELSRHTKTYDDVMSGKEAFRNLEKKDKSKFLLDRIDQIAKNVKK